jgi:hypothetical protein
MLCIPSNCFSLIKDMKSSLLSFYTAHAHLSFRMDVAWKKRGKSLKTWVHRLLLISWVMDNYLGNSYLWGNFKVLCRQRAVVKESTCKSVYSCTGILLQTRNVLNEYCRLANIHDGFNFAMFAIEDFSAKLNPSRILL